MIRIMQIMLQEIFTWVRLTAEEGYTLEGARMQVTLDGGDITDQVYSEGLVIIGAVTGDVVITAEALAE